MIAELLKHSTSSFHNLTEQLNFTNKLSDGSISKDEYIILLQRLYALFKQVSLQEDAFQVNAIFPAGFFHNKFLLIAEDLKKVGHYIIDDYIVYDELPFTEWLGFAYVAAGSMLGGQFIYQRLSTGNNNLPTNFYESCKDSVKEVWKQFIQHISAMNQQQGADILRGAKTCYLYFIYISTIIK